MSLTKLLRNQGYDLIDGPIRIHKLLQLWLKRPFNEVQLYYSTIHHAFESHISLPEIENSALSIDASTTDEYEFNIGISILEDILNSLGLGAVEINSKIQSGKRVTISYDNAVSKEIPAGDLENYLANADFQHPNQNLLRNANRNNILVINGILKAKNLVVEIETDANFDASLVAELNLLASGKLNFTKNDNNRIKMVADGIGHFPVAVKASRISFDKGHFNRINLITDNRGFF
ncbi:hypothetical protein [Galbibacter sp.]|uniref:gasdermin n=1 Tax=Galbibacter sp. TaxID=2918471 RepID=UPI003A95B579